MAKQPDYIVPINFSLTRSAREYIRETIQYYREETGTDAVAVICWCRDEITRDGKHRIIDAPILAVDERTKFPEDAIQNLDGLDLVFNVPPEIAPRFSNRLIDFSEAAGFHLNATDGFGPDKS